MDWQSLVAGALVAACSVWAVGMFLPARARARCGAWCRKRLGLRPPPPAPAAGGCGGCSGCGGCGGNTPAPGNVQPVKVVRRLPAD